MPPIGDLAFNPGTGPDGELNLGPFGSQSMLNPLSYTSQGRNLISEFPTCMSNRLLQFSN